jgi:hypothetical protein
MGNHRARAKTHLRISDSGATRCGRTGNMTLLYTEDEADVTCAVCNGAAEKRGRKPRGKYTMPDPGPHQGLGILRCIMCDRPYRDHPVAQPCMGGAGRSLTGAWPRD